MIRRGEAIDERLTSLNCIARELLWSQLSQPTQIRRLQTHGTQIGQSKMSGMPNRSHGIQTQSFDGDRKRSQWSLAANLNLACSRDGLTERCFEQSIRALSRDVPANNVATLDVQNFAGAIQQNLNRLEFSLQNLVINLMILSKQPGSDLRVMRPVVEKNNLPSPV